MHIITPSSTAISINLVVGIVSSLLGALVLVAGGWIALIIATLRRDILAGDAALAQSLEALSKDFAEHRKGDFKAFNEAFERIRKLENLPTEIEWIKDEHRRNHS